MYQKKHLITLNKDNIDIDLFNKVGYGEFADIYADIPNDKNKFIQNYFNMINYSYDYEDGFYENYDEIFNYDDDFVIIKYNKRKDSTDIDTQYHKVQIRFRGYSNNISDKFKDKVGNQITINADYLNLDIINSSIDYNLRALECNDEYSICDILYYDYTNKTGEIHKVSIILDNSVSDEFIKSFNIKNNIIDIIMDKDEFSNYGLSYYYYEQDTNNSLEHNCNNGICKLTLRNYYKNKSETHEVNYNIINNKPSKYYLSIVKDKIDIYPGETENI